MLDKTRTLLRLMFHHMADFRRHKAKDQPDDIRNLTAVAILERLALSVEDIPDEIIARYAELAIADEGTIAELENEKCAAAGFYEWPNSAEDFVNEIIAQMTGGSAVRPRMLM